MAVKTAKARPDFTSGKILKKLIIFALPLAIATLINKLFHTADVVIIGRFAGTEYQSAVGATTATVNLIVNFFLGVRTGANVVMSNAVGAKDEKRQSDILHTAMPIALIGGIIVCILGFLFAKPLLVLTKTPDDILEFSTRYLQIYFLGSPAQFVYSFGAALLRATGDSKRPVYYLTVAGVVNVVINLVTVIWLKWNVVGVALGTALAHYVSATWVVIDLMKGRAGVKFSLRKLRIHPRECKRILKIGIPNGLNTAMFSVSNLFIQSNVNAFGSAAIAGKTIAGNMEGYIATFADALMSSSIVIVGQHVGAKKEKRIPRVIGACATATMGWCALTALVLLVFGRFICGLYNTDPVVIDWAMRRIFVMEVWYFTVTLSHAFGGALRGLGKTVFPLLSNLFFTCLVRIVYLSFIYPILPNPTYELIYVIYPITWLASGIGQTIAYLIVGKKRGHFGKKQEIAEESTLLAA